MSFRPELPHETFEMQGVPFCVQALTLSLDDELSEGSFLIYPGSPRTAVFHIGGVVKPEGADHWNVWRDWESNWRQSLARRVFPNRDLALVWFFEEYLSRTRGQPDREPTEVA